MNDDCGYDIAVRTLLMDVCGISVKRMWMGGWINVMETERIDFVSIKFHPFRDALMELITVYQQKFMLDTLFAVVLFAVIALRSL